MGHSKHVSAQTKTRPMPDAPPLQARVERRTRPCQFFEVYPLDARLMAANRDWNVEEKR
jgi:hypothetical protein